MTGQGVYSLFPLPENCPYKNGPSHNQTPIPLAMFQYNDI